MTTSSKSILRAAKCRSALLLTALFVPCLVSRAAVVGPYTPDTDTVYLFHLNEPAGSYIATNAVGALAYGTNAVAFDTLTGNTFPGVNVHAPTNFNILGQSPGAGTFAFGTFGTAANMGNTTLNSQTNGLGVDMNGDLGFTLDPGPTNSIAPTNDIIAIPGTTNFGAGTIFGANYSFTLEALINVSSTNGGANQEIICGDDTQPARGFQFRLSGPNLNFNWISGNPNVNILAPIPKTGDNAFVAGQWYHVAVTHTQVPVPGGTNTILYWTHLNDTNLVANAILTNTVAAASNCPLMLVIGNEGRSAGSSLGSAEGLMGSIAEVRISNIQRGPDQMMFYSPVITFLTQPANAFVHPGDSASFSVTEAGIPPLSNQWYSVSGGVTNGIPGANGTALTIATGGVGTTNYFVIATNTFSPPTTSSVATLTIRVPLNLAWAGTGGSTWDFTTLDWTANNNVSQTAYTQLDKATFDSLGQAQPAVNLTQIVTPDSVTVAGTPSYTISGVGAIAGSGWLTKNGSGTLILTTTNTYSGPTTNAGGGLLQLGDGTASGTIGTNTVLNNAALLVNPGSGDTISFPATISGSGSFTLNASSSSSSAVLSGSNSYSGGTTVSSGSLHPRNSSALGTGNTIVSATGGQLFMDVNVDINPTPLTLNGSGITADGALRKGGSGITSFGGTITLGSDATIGVDGGATLNLTNSGGVTAGTAANLTLVGAGTGNITGPLTLGTDSLTVNGGTWTLNSAVNNYSGKTFLNGGTLIVSAPAGLGTAPGAPTADQITLGNGTTAGTLGASATFALNDGLRGITVNIPTTTSAGIFVATNAVMTIANTISGSGALTKSGNGMLVLSGNNSFAGTLNIDTSQAGSPGVNDGVTRIASPTAISGVTIIQIRNNNAGFSTLQLDDSGGALTISPLVLQWNGRNNFVPAIENVSGNNTMAITSPGTITWAVGGALYPIQSDAGTLTVTADGGLPASAPAGNRDVLLSGSGNILMSAVIQDGGATNGVIKTGTGTAKLLAANTYSSITAVSNGVLLVDGSITPATVVAPTGVTVAGGQLGGTGIINGATTVVFGGTLAPGDQAVGTLTINNNLTLAGGNVLIAVNKALSPANSNSLTSVSGTLANTGTGAIVVSNSGPALVAGDSFKLFSQPVANGAAMAVIGGGVTWNNNLAVDGSISVATTTIPQPVITSTSLNGTNLVFNGINGYTNGGYYVLSSTNLMTPRAAWGRVSTNVFTGNTFSVTNTVVPGTPQSFFTIQLQ